LSPTPKVIIELDRPTAYDINEVLDRVQDRDPTVTGIKVYFGEDSDDDDDPPTIDWQVAANCIEESHSVKYLSLWAEFSNDSVIQFFNGLAGNKSIERLDLGIYGWYDSEESVDTDKVFELLGQFIANNEKLESLVVKYNYCDWISKRSIQALCSGTSVRNISLWKVNGFDYEATREENDLFCALIEHYPLQKLSLENFIG
jgi:hypothetical protein